MRSWFLLFTLLVAVVPAAADGFRCEVAAYPARVVEEGDLRVEAAYEVPHGTARLHCEVKDLANVVLVADTAEVSGKGRHTFVVKTPKRLAAPTLLVAVWLGEDWRRPLCPIVHTPEIRVLTAAEGRRMAQMETEAPAATVSPSPAAWERGPGGEGARTPSPAAWERGPGGEGGNAAILDDDLPGLDRRVPHALADALRRRGIGVTLLDAEAFSNPHVLRRERFDVVVLADSCVFPAPARESLSAFLEAGGDLVALNGPAFQRSVWRMGERWVDRAGMLQALADAPGRHPILTFEQGDAAAWTRAANDPSAPSRLAFEGPGASGSRRAARLTLANLTGWDTFASPPLPAPFPAGHVLTCFAARGDARTPELSIEWREKDGSRWIAVVPLTTQWQRYALPPEAFRYWPDSRSQGRGGAGDHFRPENAESIVFGLAFTHTTSVGGGAHELWVDEVASAPMPEGIPALDEVLGATEGAPVIEAISPAYKLYPVPGLKRVSLNAGRVLWRPEGLPKPTSTLSPHARPQGTGIQKDRRWRWVPLLDVANRDGKPGGAAAALVINGKPPHEGGIWLSVPITDPAFFRRPAAAEAIADAVVRMLDGVFLYEGGARAYAYFDGESADLGAEVANFGRHAAEVAVEIRVAPAAGGAPVFSRRIAMSLAPGQRRVALAEWKPGHFEADDYTVTVDLLRGDRVIDTLRHPLSVWRPSPKPAFVTARAGDFWLEGRKWYPHGVNYMPSSGIGIEDQPYFEYWLDPQPYDPEVIERDLQDVKAMGMNVISVFIYARSLESRNLLDLLIRCRRLGLKVNLSLRPGTPMDFQWDQIRPIIERYRLAENDTVFAYDLAWEPFFGGYQARCAWDGEWEQWVVARYGGIEAAEKGWGHPIPRADGKVTGPSDQQVARDGEWTAMAAAYRRFVDDLLHRQYAEARRLVRAVDPNHLVSFRMTVAGDPTANQEGMPYDLKGVAGAVDVMCPEGYGRIGDWERVKPGWFTAAYARAVAPEAPVMWAEFGCSTWDRGRMQPSEKALAFQADFYRDFFEMALKSGANGTVSWWYPGGYRVNERSDYGILNPDRTWRPVSHVIHDYAARMTRVREIPRPEVVLPIHRDRHADGIRGVYTELKDAFWKAVEEGRTPGLRWEDAP